MINWDISQDRVKVFFVVVLHRMSIIGYRMPGYPVFLDCSKYLKENRCLLQWISVFSGIRLPTSPKEMKIEYIHWMNENWRQH